STPCAFAYLIHSLIIIPFLSYSHAPPHHILSFPTRRSSDLLPEDANKNTRSSLVSIDPRTGAIKAMYGGPDYANEDYRMNAATRSEEHTSELQSRFDLVCRLLLEKKN